MTAEATEDAFWELGGDSCVEVKIKRSLFLGYAARCPTVQDARAHCDAVSAEHKNATHNCKAWRIRTPAQEYATDDGEPSGTAGRPILGAIKRCEVWNAAVVVTRYFGGVKLGRRGLVEAYGDVAQQALLQAGRQWYVPMRAFFVTLGYKNMGKVDYLLQEFEARVNRTFGATVQAVAEVPAVRAQELETVLQQLQDAGEIVRWHAEKSS